MKTPSINKSAFTCPHCSAYSRQAWFQCGVEEISEPPQKEIDSNQAFEALKKMQSGSSSVTSGLASLALVLKNSPSIDSGVAISSRRFRNVWVSQCDSCENFDIWLHNRMVYPSKIDVTSAHPDTPEEILPDYNEAAQLFSISPRASAAILRLSLEKLLKHIGLKGDDINRNIANLVDLGINEELQRSMDILRILGNESVHHGTINLNEDTTTANKLFLIFNLIVEKTITNKNMLAEIYDKLPENKVNGIHIRDKNAK